MKAMKTKPKEIIKRIVDLAIYVMFLLLMGQCVLRGAVHEWLGIAIGVLFVFHNVLNLKWYKAIFKGKYNALRFVQVAVNFLLIIAVVLCAVSGILVSQHIFSVESASAVEFGHHLHLVATAWAFVLMTVHLGLHWSVLTLIKNKFVSKEKAKKCVVTALYFLETCLCACGLYQFVDRRFWEELFHLIDYQKEFDFSKSPLEYFLGSVALSALFVAAAHYAKKLMLQKRREKGELSPKNKRR